MKLDEIRSRPATLVANTRMDARHIATLAKYWRSNGNFPTSVSELLRLSIESLSDLLVLNQRVEFVDSTNEAFLFLEACGLLTKGAKKNSRNIQDALRSESLSLDSLDGLKPETFVSPTPPGTLSLPERLAIEAELHKHSNASVAQQVIDAHINSGAVPTMLPSTKGANDQSVSTLIEMENDPNA
jgi:hypothetical protein